MALKVFVVEDNEVMRKHLVELLSEDANIDWVGAAETEAEAKDWLERNPHGWDIAILDLFLREGTGAGVLRHCRNRSETQDVLLMTNYPISSLLTHCRLLGVNAIYDKSTELGDLIAYCIGRAFRASNPQPRLLAS